MPNTKDAAKSLRFYKNCYTYNIEENKRFVEAWENVELIAKQSVDRGEKVSFEDFCEYLHLVHCQHFLTEINGDPILVQGTREARIGLLKGFCIIGLFLFSGAPILTNYVTIIFKDSGSKLDPSLSSIIMITIQLIATTIATVFIDNFGRRFLLVVSSLGTSIGLYTMGVYNHLSYNKYTLDGYDWVPVTSLSFAVFMTHIGLVPLVFVVLMEVLPVKVRNDSLLISFNMFLSKTDFHIIRRSDQ